MKKFKLLKAFVMLLVLAMVISGCGGSTTTSTEDSTASTDSTTSTDSTSTDATSGDFDGVEGGILKYGLSGESTSLEPANGTGEVARTLNGMVYNTLITLGEDGSYQPELAYDWDVSDDGLSYTFYLEDTTFHDGTPFTAEDVKYTIERMTSDAIGASFKSVVENFIASVEVVDDHTVKLNLTSPDSAILAYLSTPFFYIVSEAYTEANGGELSTADPMGTGAFIWAGYTPGEVYKFVKNENYFKEGYPKLDGIDAYIYTDETARMNALYSGDLDMISYVRALDVESLIADEDYTTYIDYGLYAGIDFNTQVAPFDNPKVREAIAYAIDRDAVRQAAFAGRGASVYGMPSDASYIGYEEQLFDNQYSYDPEKAKELLAEAGYPDGFDAVMTVCSQYSFFVNTALVAQQNLADIGINLTFDEYDFATILGMWQNHDYDITVCGRNIGVHDLEWMTQAYGDSINNFTDFHDETFNGLLETAAGKFIEEERAAAFQDAVEYFYTVNPTVFLVYRESVYASSSNIGGFYFKYHGQVSNLDITYFKK